MMRKQRDDSKSHRLGRRITGACLAAILTLPAAMTAYSDSNIAQVPLLLTSDVSPNVMFVIDDSGSMQWEYMPDDDFLYSTFMFPRPDEVYGPVDYANWVPNFDDSNYHNFFGRSAHNNATFYDPTVDYRPWVDADGNSMPDADPANAWYNPVDRDLGGRDLTRELTESALWFSGNGFDDAVCDPVDADGNCGDDHTYWPITYFVHTGGDVNERTSYDKIEIRSGTVYVDGTPGSAADLPSGRTIEDEVQNFANWHTYHRSRILAARGGIGRAFAQQADNIRVGFGSINTGTRTIDGVESSNTIRRGVRAFGGADREAFFDELYNQAIDRSATPLRRSVRGVGEYYERRDAQGPWSRTPGDSGGDPDGHLECRASYNVLMTDGFWNGPSPDVGNVDGSDGPTITGPDGRSFQYEQGPPYADDHSNTLADAAMDYWNRDLRPDLENRVPVSPINEAFWQHMVTFGVGLGVQGTLDPDSDLAALANGEIDWPDPQDSSAAKIDDLWHASLNSRGDFFSAADPDTFADELSHTLAALVARTEGSAASVAANSTRLDTDTRIFQARFDSSNWSGALLSFTLNPDGSVGTQAWDAAEQIPDPANRNIYTQSGGSGTEFQFANLDTDQQDALNRDINGSLDVLGAARVDYLRGDTSQEAQNGGALQFRNRPALPSGNGTNVLGDIVNSSPFLVGNQNFGYSTLPEGDADSDTPYRDFRNDSEDRPEVLYVGANDGMLHAIDATSGEELFAYVPAGVYDNLSALTSRDYTHRYFVDGELRAVDAHIGGAWRTVLVGSTGAGGRSVFALDVTNPTSFDQTDVMWEFTHEDLGATIGQPTIARTQGGDWVAIFGNGYESDNHTAQLFVVDLADGSLLARIDTDEGSAADPNGMASPIPVDTTGNRVTNFVYAGDLHGNLWKFDFETNNTNNADIAFSQGGGSPLFSAVAGDGERQPITTRPEVGRNPDGGYMVYFGTGKLFEKGDEAVGMDPQIQAFYGIQDVGSRVSGRGELQAQTIELEFTDTDQFTGGGGFEFRIMSDNQVDYGTQNGWYLDLVYPTGGSGDGERVVERPVLRQGRIIFVTTIPSTDPCDFGGTGWLMELDALNGSRLDRAVFDLDGDGSIDDGDMADLNGTPAHATGRRVDDVITSPTVLDTGGDTEFKYMSGASGQITVIEESASGGELGRQSWRQLR